MLNWKTREAFIIFAVCCCPFSWIYSHQKSESITFVMDISEMTDSPMMHCSLILLSYSLDLQLIGRKTHQSDRTFKDALI